MRNPLVFGSRLGLLAACLAVAFAVTTTAGIKRPIKKLSLDPSAEQVELFDGMDEGTFEVTVIMKDEFEGNVFVENKSSKTVTVKLPKAAAAVQVLKQGFGPAGGGQPGQGGQGQQGNGQSQSGGGGFGGQQGQGGQQGLGGQGGFFSVPAEKTVQVPFTSVCLNHGKPTPKAHMTYKLVRVETYTKDPVLQELIEMVGTGKLERGAAQAAVWHVTDDMSWETLAAKSIRHTGQGSSPYFSRAQLQHAMSLVAQAQGKVKERNGGELPKKEQPKL